MYVYVYVYVRTVSCFVGLQRGTKATMPTFQTIRYLLSKYKALENYEYLRAVFVEFEGYYGTVR